MGINFDCFLEHRLAAEEIQHMDALLRREWQRKDSPLRALPPMPGRNDWAWLLLSTSLDAATEFEAKGYLELEGPVDLQAIFFRQALNLGAATRWGEFLCDEEIQAVYCRAVKGVAKRIGAGTAIYLPETIANGFAFDVLSEGSDIARCLAVLARDYGPPAESLAAVTRAWEEGLDQDHYFCTSLK